MKILIFCLGLAIGAGIGYYTWYLTSPTLAKSNNFKAPTIQKSPYHKAPETQKWREA